MLVSFLILKLKWLVIWRQQTAAKDSEHILLLPHWFADIIIKKAQQRMFFLRQLRKFNMPRKVMVEFYTATIESILTSSITVWFAASTAKDKGRLQRIIRSAEKVIGCDLPALLDLFHSRTSRRAGKIIAEPSHPGHHLFQRLPSGKRFRAIRTKTSRHLNSFFPMAVGLTNKPPAPHWLCPTTHNSPPPPPCT